MTIVNHVRLSGGFTATLNIAYCHLRGAVQSIVMENLYNYQLANIKFAYLENSEVWLTHASKKNAQENGAIRENLNENNAVDGFDILISPTGNDDMNSILYKHSNIREFHVLKFNSAGKFLGAGKAFHIATI